MTFFLKVGIIWIIIDQLWAKGRFKHMKKLLLILAIFIFTISNAHAEKLFINFKNAKTITVQQVETALKKGANVNARDTDGATPLMYASGYNPTVWDNSGYYNPNPKIIELLLNHGANIHAKEKNGMTPLMVASEKNTNPKVIELLLKHGANVNAKDADDRTPLIFASSGNTPQVIELLLSHGANINAKEKYAGVTPLMRASESNKNPKVIELLLKHGANINDYYTSTDSSNDEYGSTPFMLSVENDNPTATKVFLNHGAKPTEWVLYYIDTKCQDSKMIELFSKYPR